MVRNYTEYNNKVKKLFESYVGQKTLLFNILVYCLPLFAVSGVLFFVSVTLGIIAVICSFIICFGFFFYGLKTTREQLSKNNRIAYDYLFYKNKIKIYIHIKDDVAPTEIEYYGFKKIVEYDYLVLFYLNKNYIMILDKDTFTKGSSEDLTKILSGFDNYKNKCSNKTQK